MACSYYEFRGSLFGGDYYCLKKNSEVNNDVYYRYCRNYSYDECPIYRNTRDEHSSTGCFITTVTCAILKKDNNDEVMNILRKFRDNVLQKNKKHYNILKEYDVVGPVIANAILNDKSKEVIARKIYKEHLAPICKDIVQKNYDKAIFRYKAMTFGLVKHYNLNEEYDKAVESDYYGYNNDINKLGHGKTLKRTKIN